MSNECNERFCGGMSKRITGLRGAEKELRDEARLLVTENARLQKMLDAEIAAHIATVERSTRAIKLLQSHCRSQWSQGNVMGQASASSEAKEAVNRLEEEVEGRATDNAAFTEEVMRLEEALKNIGDFAHDHSTGPALPDALWEIRRMAYEGFITSVVK